MKVRTILFALSFLSSSAFASQNGVSIQYSISATSGSPATLRTQIDGGTPQFVRVANAHSAIYSFSPSPSIELRVYGAIHPENPVCKIELKKQDMIEGCELTAMRVSYRIGEGRCEIRQKFCVTK